MEERDKHTRRVMYKMSVRGTVRPGKRQKRDLLKRRQRLGSITQLHFVVSNLTAMRNSSFFSQKVWPVRSRGLLNDFANNALGKTMSTRAHTPYSQKSDDSYEMLAERSEYW